MDERMRSEIAEIIKGIEKNSVKIEYSECDEKFELGASKIGGKPHLPKNFVWPYYEGENYSGTVKKRPLAFLAQFNMEDVASCDSDGLLPKTGLLSFFYELYTQAWGYDPKHKGCARVFYFEKGTELAETELPEWFDDMEDFNGLKVNAESVITFPDYSQFMFTDEFDIISKRFPELDDWWDEYYDICVECGEFDKKIEEGKMRLLGYPDVIQNPMESECEKVTRGFYCGGGHVEMTEELEAEIEKDSKEWMLLFQMGTFDCGKFGVEFGDCGCIYFWIKKNDLEKRNFDNIWLILQCG